MPQAKRDLAILELPDQDAWEHWLEDNHGSGDGVWLKFAKKGSGRTTVTYSQAVEVALCYGWIDGQVARLDDSFYLQRFTPRRARSQWSQINRAKAEALIAANRMRPAGLEAIEAAKAAGSWNAAYPPQSRAEVPEDFQRALDQDVNASEFFAALTGSARYVFLYRLHNTHKPEARQRRIAQYVALLAQGKTLG